MSSGNIFYTSFGGVVAKFNGSQPRSRPATLVEPSDHNRGDARAIAIDTVSQHLYVASLVPTGAQIWRVDFDGSNLIDIVSLPNQVPVGMTLDDSHLFWSDARTDAIYEVKKSGGGGIQTLLSPSQPPLEAASSLIRDFAYDDATQKLYWKDSYRQEIRRMDTDGSNIETLVSLRPEVDTGTTYTIDVRRWDQEETKGLFAKGSVAIKGNHVIWSDAYDESVKAFSSYYGAGQRDAIFASVWKASKDGSSPEKVFTTQSFIPFNVSTTPSSDDLWISTLRGELVRYDGLNSGRSLFSMPFITDVLNLVADI